MKVFLSGEGVSELGDHGRPPQYRAHPPRAGALEAFLQLVLGLGLALMATEAGCDALVFTRDRDRYTERADDVNAGLRDVQNRHEFRNLKLAGAVAIEELEAWILAFLGEPRTECLADPKSQLYAQLQKDGAPTDLAQLVLEKGLDQIPDDAESLRHWLARLRHLV